MFLWEVDIDIGLYLNEWIRIPSLELMKNLIPQLI